MNKESINIEYIFFDIGNVLIYVDKEIALRELPRRFNVPADRIINEVMNTLEPSYEKGEMTTADYLASLQKLFKTDGLDIEKYMRKLLHKIFTPNPFLIAQLKELRKRFKLFLLSNTNPLHISVINNSYNLEKEVHGAIYSFTVKSLKPDPEIYRKSLEITGARAESSLLIDDLQENVNAAREAGFHTIRFQNNLQLKKELKLFGINLLHPLKIQ